MDIARPELKRQKRRRQIILAVVALAALVGVTVGVSRLKPAAPSVERGTVWTDTVKRGPMLRQVRGLGTLIPSQEFTRQIPAETEATVIEFGFARHRSERSTPILLEMSSPQVEQTALDAELQLKAAEAAYQSLHVRLDSELMNQKAGAATVTQDYSQAKFQAETDKALYDLGVISGLDLQRLERPIGRTDNQKQSRRAAADDCRESDRGADGRTAGARRPDADPGRSSAEAVE